MAMLFTGPLLMQVPIGWISDRVDRRYVIFAASGLGAIFCLFGAAMGNALPVLLAIAFLSGGVTMPLYALLLAYVNDALPTEDMPAASGGLALTFGFGAILGPLIAGAVMQFFGSYMYWIMLATTCLFIALFALYRMTQRAVVAPSETESYLASSLHHLQLLWKQPGQWGNRSG